MNKEKKLSVIVPVYNVEKYLHRCVDSIINQTFRNLEIILVDDGSTDNSGAICDEYALRDKRIVVIHQQNSGSSKARFEGLKRTTCKYVTFVDSDDWIAENMYEVLFHKICEGNADLVTCGCVRYWNEKRFINDVCVRFPEGFYSEREIVEKIIPHMLYDEKTNDWALDPSLCMKIFRKDLLLPVMTKTGNCTFHYGDDTAVTFLYMLNVKSLVVTHEYFYFHRHRESNVVAPYFTDPLFLDKLYEVYHFLRGEFSKSKYKDILIRQLEFFFVKGADFALRKYNMSLRKQKNYLFPFDKVKRAAPSFFMVPVLLGNSTMSK